MNAPLPTFLRLARQPRRWPLLASLSTVVLMTTGCDPFPVEPPPDAQTDAPIDTTIDVPDAQVGACPAVGTTHSPSLVVTDPEVLARFSFSRVMTQILASADINPAQSPRVTYQTWMHTFDRSPGSGDCDDPTIDPEHFGLACPRLPETRLGQVDPFLPGSGVEFVPLGLFNRFDLAPADGSNCGEYRIVFGLDSRTPLLRGRALMIFEGILANPTPERGIDACLPVASFWQGLSNDFSPTSVATKLEAFYFAGGAVPGFPPVVTAHSYGLARGATAAHGAGQVRTNFFIDSVEWQLREFKLRRTCTDPSTASTCRLVFEHVTVKANPAEELFAGGHPRSASFVSQFVAQLPRLVGQNLASLSIAPADGFNEFESVSSVPTVDYDQIVDPSVRFSIQQKLQSIGSFLSTTHVLRRATTQTCAGCHQQSNNVPLGGGLVWPASLEFTHIDENHRLSPALTTAFLPHRRQVLENFINARCAADLTRAADRALDARDIEALIANGQTIGGSAVGAAN